MTIHTNVLHEVVLFKNKRSMKKIILIASFFALTAHLWSQSENPITTNHSLRDVRRNSLSLEIAGEGILGSINYDRLFPVSEKDGFILGVSAVFLADFVGDIGFIHGRSKHFLEIGIGYSFPEQLVTPQSAYRYQADQGFLFKAGLMYFQSTQQDSFGDFPWFGISFGNSY